jgi:hypothetical protein
MDNISSSFVVLVIVMFAIWLCVMILAISRISRRGKGGDASGSTNNYSIFPSDTAPLGSTSDNNYSPVVTESNAYNSNAVGDFGSGNYGSNYGSDYSSNDAGSSYSSGDSYSGGDNISSGSGFGGGGDFGGGGSGGDFGGGDSGGSYSGGGGDSGSSN